MRAAAADIAGAAAVETQAWHRFGNAGAGVSTCTRVKRRVNWAAPGGPVLEDCDLAYSVMETPVHRDIIKELCDAGHRHGLAIDLYFSHTDWYDSDS